MSRPAGSGRPRGSTSRCKVWPSFQARCRCGWSGQIYGNSPDAAAEAKAHRPACPDKKLPHGQTPPPRPITDEMPGVLRVGASAMSTVCRLKSPPGGPTA